LLTIVHSMPAGCLRVRLFGGAAVDQPVTGGYERFAMRVGQLLPAQSLRGFAAGCAAIGKVPLAMFAVAVGRSAICAAPDSLPEVVEVVIGRF
jgi:hypothetical protein